MSYSCYVVEDVSTINCLHLVIYFVDGVIWIYWDGKLKIVHFQFLIIEWNKDCSHFVKVGQK